MGAACQKSTAASPSKPAIESKATMSKTDSLKSESSEQPPSLRKCSMGFATGAAITYFLKMHPEVPREAANSLQADLDRSQPLYFWQLYSVLGTDLIVKIVENLYASIAADIEEPWLPKAFTRISGWDHHVASQAAFWLDAMGRGKCYHGGEGRLEFHHHHNAGHVMTQVGAARWMHHMRLALDKSDLGPDPRVSGTIEEFLRTRMEKYASQFAFQTGDRVYKSWCADDWERTASWHKFGPQACAPKMCPITGQVGNCEMGDNMISETSTSASPSRQESPQSSSSSSAAAKDAGWDVASEGLEIA